jgi:hypothetical protein
LIPFSRRLQDCGEQKKEGDRAVHHRLA